MAGEVVRDIQTPPHDTSRLWYLVSPESSQLKDMTSKASVAERFSLSMLSQGQSSASSRGERMSSSFGRQLNLTHESSSHSHAEQSQRREELALLRTLAEMHCILAEVKIHYKAHYLEMDLYDLGFV